MNSMPYTQTSAELDPVGGELAQPEQHRHPRMGDIGQDPHEVEFEPIEEPSAVPEPVRVPVAPEPERVPVPG